MKPCCSDISSPMAFSTAFVTASMIEVSVVTDMRSRLVYVASSHKKLVATNHLKLDTKIVTGAFPWIKR